MFCSATSYGKPTKRLQTVYKPGSVRLRCTAIPLGQVLQPASRDQPGRRNGNVPACHVAMQAGRPYSVLLPVGFTLPAPLPAPRCALTAPFHPYPRWLTPCRAVCFLWHCPWGHPRRPLAGTVFPWSPDFPPPGRKPKQRPSNRLDAAPCAFRPLRSTALLLSPGRNLAQLALFALVT